MVGSKPKRDSLRPREVSGSERKDLTEAVAWKVVFTGTCCCCCNEGREEGEEEGEADEVPGWEDVNSDEDEDDAGRAGPVSGTGSGPVVTNDRAESTCELI